MSSYLIDGRLWSGQEPDFDNVLAEAHDRHRRPLCLCSVAGVETYIARLPDGWIVKRLPYTGSQHAPSCAHFEPPADASGLGHVMGSAISEDIESGMTLLKLGFAMSKGASRKVSRGAGDAKGSVASDGTRLSLRGFLHFLWDQGELTQWRSCFAGKRTWAIVRSHLLNAAHNKMARGSPISTSLYVPEVFNVERRDEINARRTTRFLRGVAANAGAGRPLLLLIGELKEVVPSRFGFKAVIKHVPDQIFALDRQLHRRMCSRFASELSLWTASDSIRMVMIATFGIDGAGIPSLEELSLMPVNLQWIPIEDVHDQQFVDRLVNDSRAFVKLLNYDAQPTCLRTSAMLLDVEGGARHLRIDRPGNESEDSCVDAFSDLDETDPWTWTVDKEALPKFPARQAVPRRRFASTDVRVAASEPRA